MPFVLDMFSKKCRKFAALLGKGKTIIMSNPVTYRPRLRRLLLVITMTTVWALSFWLVVSAQSTPLSKFGYLDFPYTGWNGAGAPTGEKPESKLWWNDGFWWGALYNSGAGELRIYRYNWGTNSWEDTGIPIDDRDNTKTDVLWDAATKKLYIASHVAVVSDGEESSDPANWARLYRYSYDATLQRYALDANFPTTINRDVSETLVLAKGAANRLWITYVSRGNSSGLNANYRVFVNSSADDGASWGNAFVPTLSPALTTTQVARGDIVSLVTVGDKVGLMWNNSKEKALAHSTLNFALHDSTSTSGAWATQIITIPHGADDHVSIRALHATSSGQVFAAVKTDYPISGTITDVQPLVGMVALDLSSPGDPFVFREYSRNIDKDTRPVLVIDEGDLTTQADDRILIFVTGKEQGSKICYKALNITFPLSNLGEFPVGDCGTAFIEDDIYQNINDATTMKQNMNKTTGLVILASDAMVTGTTAVNQVYVHNALGNPPPVMTARGPLPGATNVLLSSVVTATFSKQLNPATLTANSFSVVTANGPVAGALTYAANSRTATFTPAALLAANTFYTATLTNGIQDTSNQGLNAGIDPGPVIEQWRFMSAGPAVAFAAANYQVNEVGGAATITVALSAPSALPVSVTYATSDNSATAGNDYTTTTGALIFAPGEMFKTFAVPIVNDPIQDGVELLNLTLSNPVSATLGLIPTATLTIIDDDSATVQFGLANFSANENSGSATINVTLSRAAAFPVTVDYIASNGTALTGSDYSATTGTLTFAPGEMSKSFPVAITNDNLFENSETVNLTLQNNTPVSVTISPLGKQAQLTIVDDDPQPVVTFSQSNYTVNEAGGTATVTVSLSSLSSFPVTVDFATANGTALAGSDYTANSGKLTFAPGERNKSFTVVIRADALDESDENVELKVSNPSGASLSTPGMALLTITDDDPTPTMQFAQATTAVNESNTTLTITVTLNAPSGQLVTVNYASSNGTATEGADYAAVSGALTFAPGTVQQSFELTILDDTLVEAAETVNLTLSNPNHGLLGAQASRTLTIIDNEIPQTNLYLPLVRR